ncbi:MBL fold metallo-hydrolase [Marinicauda algicola]|uniref:MBL fold metallo-hydrolase n=1 Tax=Marinicauda algicola TaxID=2029849 RepID=UPI0013052C27|nr:MBL fold metallo-hydrolase [Marinicauda algicola]
MIQRIPFALLAILAACGDRAPDGTTAAAPAAPAPDYHLIEGTLFRSDGPNGNTYIYDAPDGLVVIDTGRHPEHAQLILDHARERGQPIAAIVNTHWHLDHTTGNLDLRAEFPEAAVYATPASREARDGRLSLSRLRAQERLDGGDLDDATRARLERASTLIGGEALIPTVEVTGTMTLPVTGRDLELNTTDHAVSASDIWIWDAATRTVIAGDLVVVPAPLFDSACPARWSEALAAIDQKPFERLAPGHGPAMTKAEFGVYRDAFDRLVSCAAERTGEECARGWLEDAAPLLRDERDRDYARDAVTAYVDVIIKDEELQATYCGTPG